MRQAIKTILLLPTLTKKLRIKAKCLSGEIDLNFDDTLSADSNHEKAANMLAKKIGLENVKLLAGSVKPGECCFIPIQKKIPLRDMYCKSCEEWTRQITIRDETCNECGAETYTSDEISLDSDYDTYRKENR